MYAIGLKKLNILNCPTTKKRGNKTNMGKCVLLIFLHNQPQETGNIGYASFVHVTV